VGVEAQEEAWEEEAWEEEAGEEGGGAGRRRSQGWGGGRPGPAHRASM
jgi:hypothetical protein